MDHIERVARPGSTLPGTDKLTSSDADATAEAVRWLAAHYLMKDAFARILLGQLARQHGVTEAAAARSVLTAAVVDSSTPTSMP